MRVTEGVLVKPANWANLLDILALRGALAPLQPSGYTYGYIHDRMLFKLLPVASSEVQISNRQCHVG